MAPRMGSEDLATLRWTDFGGSEKENMVVIFGRGTGRGGEVSVTVVKANFFHPDIG